MKIDFFQEEDFNTFLKGVIKDEKKRHSCYSKTCEHAEEMAVHVYGDKPEKLLTITRPNESPEIKQYRLDVYQPKTKSTTEKAISVLYKIFNQQLFTIKWPDQNTEGKILEDYCMEYYPMYNNILVYLQEAVTPKMIADPNAVIAIKPQAFDIPDTERVKPLAVMYGSKNIWHIDYQTCLVFIRSYKDSARKNREIYVFEWYDSSYIIRFEADFIKHNTLETEIIDRYAHGCPEMPVWQLRGKPVANDDGTFMYKSFFDAALPYWNDAIGHESDLKGAFINHIHPLRYEYDEPCTHRKDGQPCKNGTIAMPDGSRVSCPACNGTGYKGAANSPYRIIRINRDKVPGQNDAGNFPVPVGFVTVPTEPTDLLDNYVDKQHKKGLEALNMDVVDDVGENQSGVAKTIDRGELYDFLSRISTVIFDVHLNNIFYYFNAMMFGVSQKMESPVEHKEKLKKNLPTVVKPVQFDIFSTSELISQLSEAKTAGLNPNYMKAAQKEVIDKKFTDPQARQFMDLVFELDPVPDLTPDEITMLAANGTYKQTDVVIHFNISQFISRALYEQRDKFIKADKAEKMKTLEVYANETIKAGKTTIQPKV